MRTTDLPSLGPTSRSHNLRRDLAKVLSDISTAHDRGSDVTDRLDAVQAVCRAMLLECKRIKNSKRGTGLVPQEPVQQELSLSIPNE